MEETMSKKKNPTNLFETIAVTKPALGHHTEGEILDAILDLANREVIDGPLDQDRAKQMSWLLAEVLRRRLDEHQRNRPEHAWMTTEPAPNVYNDNELLYRITVLSEEEFHCNGLSPSNDDYLMALLWEAKHRGIDNQLSWNLASRVDG